MKLGVYQSHQRYSAIALKVKDGQVFYLATAPMVWLRDDNGVMTLGVGDPDNKVRLLQHKLAVFEKNWPMHLPAYPVRRAARVFSAPPYHPTEAAAAILARLLGGE
jgi:hypothetical protein